MNCKVVFGLITIIACTLVIYAPKTVNADPPGSGGACGAGDEINTRGHDSCLPDKAGDHAPDQVPKKDRNQCHPGSSEC